MVKHLTRQQLRKVLEGISADEVHHKSVQACDRLCASEEFRRASVVMLFLSLSNEVETSHAILKAFQMDKTVVVPSIVWKDRHLVPITIHSLDCEMKHDRHGLRYPKDGEPMPTSEIDLVVVPGLGFDDQGNRLGRGGGFYDRFLSRDGFSGVSCGLAFEEQVVDAVPVLDHDVGLDLLVTDQQVRRFAKVNVSTKSTP